MKSAIRFSPLALLLLLARDVHSFSKVSTYLQFRRGHKFVQMEERRVKMGANFSRDLDEVEGFRLEDAWTQAPDTDSLEFHNLEKPIDHVGHLLESDAVSGKRCSVSEQGQVNLTWGAGSFFDQRPHDVSIVAGGIKIYADQSPQSQSRLIPFDSIKLPIETIDEARECWSMKTDEGKMVLCDRTKEGRDAWVHNILKALFCYNSNNLHIEEMQRLNRGPAKLSRQSTVEKRLQENKVHVFQPGSGATKRKMNPNYFSVDLTNDGESDMEAEF